MNIDDTIIYTVVASLAGVIAYMWKAQAKRDAEREVKIEAKIEAKAADCDRKHEESSKTIIALSSEVGELRGEVKLAKSLEPKLDEILVAVKDNKRV